MTMCSVYIGDLCEPSFDWDGGEGIPSSLCREFPPDDKPYLRCFHQWVEESGVECKPTWHEVWVAKVTKSQIYNFIEYCYGSDPSYTDSDKWLAWEGRPYLVDRLDAIKEFVSRLVDQKQYALVAMEVY